MIEIEYLGVIWESAPVQTHEMILEDIPFFILGSSKKERDSNEKI